MYNEVLKHFLEEPQEYLRSATNRGDFVTLLILPNSQYTYFNLLVLPPIEVEVLILIIMV
jgi:hypothetical protein